MATNSVDADETATRLRPVRLVAAAAILAGGLWLSTIVVRIGLSQEFLASARLGPAYVTNRRDGMAAGHLAWVLQRAGADKAAAIIARQSIAATPLSAQAVSVLAVDHARHDPQRASALLDRATRMTRRDPVTQLWAARVALARGRFELAARHADAAARIGGARGEVRALIDTMNDGSTTRAAIVARLAFNPPWRTEYLSGTAKPVGNIAARASALAALASTPAPPTAAEQAAVIEVAAAKDGLPAAYRLWRRLNRPTSLGFVNDPQFAAVVADGEIKQPFRWTLFNTIGASAAQDANGGGLHASSDGLSAGLLAEQVVALPPGRREFSVKSRYSSPSAGDAFRWTIACIARAGQRRRLPIVEGSAVGNVRFSVDVPSDADCRMLAIRLEAQQADQPMPVEAWFSNARVD